MSTDTSHATSTTANVLGVIGVVAYAATGFLYLTSGLVVPVPWIAVLWVIWLAGLYWLVRTFRRRRRWTPVVPIAAVVLWWLFVTIGGTLFGWTA
ncbi:MAG TPA: hypothetical protein VFT85_01965 [Acidimicrobiia bacterium]|nr:hypothetical protein [Acidimicrobiia bacterium]